MCCMHARCDICVLYDHACWLLHCLHLHRPLSVKISPVSDPLWCFLHSIRPRPWTPNWLGKHVRQLPTDSTSWQLNGHVACGVQTVTVLFFLHCDAICHSYFLHFDAICRS